MKCLCAAISIWITANIVSSDEWGYTELSEWGGLCKTGTQQSPIDLIDSNAEAEVFQAFSFNNYNIYNNATITNNGHSVAIHIDGPLPKVSGGGFLGDYILNHFHFHWQSEHTINGKRFPLEMHLVHFSSRYSTLQEAVKHVGGVAVLGVLFHQSLDHDEDFIPLVQSIGQVIHDHNKQATLEKPIAAKDFLPRDKSEYYRYMGSLTTPDCNEGVIWTVFANTLPMSADQVNHFEAVTLEDGPQTINYRPVQPLNGRVVSLRSNPFRVTTVSPSTTIGTSIKTILICTILSFLESKRF